MSMQELSDEATEAMEREETAYWLGMAMHRPNPRRVLTALRTLLMEWVIGFDWNPHAVGHRSNRQLSSPYASQASTRRPFQR